MTSSCLFLNTYYEAFLRAFYAAHSQLLAASYAEQLQALRAEMFGDSDFYSYYLEKAGWRAEDIIINCEALQKAWAQEKGVVFNSMMGLVVEQIKHIKPEVLYVQDMHVVKGDFLELLRPYVELIVGQAASALPADTPIGGYDLVVSSFPHFVARLREKGIAAFYQPLAFDTRVLSKIERIPYNERPIEFSFVGGISSAHSNALSALESLCEKTYINIWGYGRESLNPNSAIHGHHQGEVWGRKMFQTLASSKITWNRHVEAAEEFANNMRLFEATGCGALLITDYKQNLDELFEIGKEIVAYRSVDECVALVQYYLRHPEEAMEIAAAGQARTLKEHTYEKRMIKTAEFLGRQLRYKREQGCFGQLDTSRISYGYTPIERTQITQSMTSGWQNPDLPSRQRVLVQEELGKMYKGQAPVVYQAMARVLEGIVEPGASILEIGCSSGYYYEVIEYLLNKRITYHGVDYSAAMIEMARDYYPLAKFTIADGSQLPFPDESFDVAISSCVLLHVPNYPQHIKETVRVARDYVVAHRTPVCKVAKTQYLRKIAYEVETVEMLFNETEILSLFLQEGLHLVGSVELERNEKIDQYTLSYLFRKRK